MELVNYLSYCYLTGEGGQQGHDHNHSEVLILSVGPGNAESQSLSHSVADILFQQRRHKELLLHDESESTEREKMDLVNCWLHSR